MSDAAENSLLKLRPLEESAVKMFFESVRPLREYFEAPDVAEIMINDFRNVFIESRGKMHRLDLELNQSTLNGAILSLATLGREVGACGYCPGDHQRGAFEPAYRGRHATDCDRRTRHVDPQTPRQHAFIRRLRVDGRFLASQRA